MRMMQVKVPYYDLFFLVHRLKFAPEQGYHTLPVFLVFVRVVHILYGDRLGVVGV